MIRSILLGLLLGLILIGRVDAGIYFGGNGLSGGYRWDAAPRSVAGEERSLQGGLRYSVAGGSYQSFRDQFSWNSVPTVAAFQQTVERSFGAWTSVDPVSGLGTSVSFVADFSTQVRGSGSFGVLNPAGAEIDLFGLNAGDTGTRGYTSFNAVGFPVTLTSGVSNYQGSAAISGADIHINSNPGAVYSLEVFGRLLTHEIGHTLGLGDADLGGQFIDDNFNPLNPVATLNNSWAGLVNPLDPSNSAGLSTFNIPGSTFSITGIDLLMESNGLGISAGNPLSNLIPLTADEYGMRQFLYPIVAVPEPGSLMLMVVVTFYVWRRNRIASIISRADPHASALRLNRRRASVNGLRPML